MSSFALFYLFSLISVISSCPSNCFCSEFDAECTVTSCSDDLDTEYSMITIQGQLCEEHRYILQNIVDGTTVILKDDVCGAIPNCMYDLVF